MRAAHMKIPFIIGYWTGVRAGEIVNLKWDQVNIDEGWIRLEPGTTKSGKGRSIPLVTEVREVFGFWKNLTLTKYPACAWVCHYRGERMKRFSKRMWIRFVRRWDYPASSFTI